VREESHLDDMRAAIRGDFERLEERRGEQELMRPARKREGEDETLPEPDPVVEPEQDPGPDAIVEPEPAPVEEALPRSWLDRLLGR
jgi:hypothetical protein